MKWAPGQSGNPYGRPTGTGHLQKIRRHRRGFVQALIDGVKDPDPRVRVECIKLGLAYCYGTPPREGREEPASRPLTVWPMTPEELAEAEAAMKS